MERLPLIGGSDFTYSTGSTSRPSHSLPSQLHPLFLPPAPIPLASMPLVAVPPHPIFKQLKAPFVTSQHPHPGIRHTLCGYASTVVQLHLFYFPLDSMG